jgi:hypothetical protein
MLGKLKFQLVLSMLLLVMLSYQPLCSAMDLAGLTLDLQVAALDSSADLEILLSVDAGPLAGQPADWLLVVFNEQQGWRYLDLASGQLQAGLTASYTGPLVSIDNLPVRLPLAESGNVQIYFGVDLVPDGEATLESGVLGYTGTAVSLNGNWWRPTPGVSWQWQLSDLLDPSVAAEMYDIDLMEVAAEEIASLKQAGRKVVCYFSAGSWEEWREDAALIPAAVLGKVMDGWPDERWLDIRNIAALTPVMSARLDLAVTKGCDGVEPDNVDGYQNQSGFALSAADQLAYNRWLATQAHLRGLSIGLKNDLDQIVELEPYFDWALNEQCFEMEECSLLLPFVQAGKAVFGVEYNLAPAEFCTQANALNFDWLLKNLDLDAARTACR